MFSLNSVKRGLQRSSSMIVLCTFVLASCSGGGGGSSSITPGPAPSPAPAPVATGDSFSLNGAAQKGIILNGYVQVTDAADPANVLISGQRTDANSGAYNLTIPDTANFQTENAYVKVTVTGGAGALMVCDAPTGCSEAAFGESFAIDDTVSISALLAAPAEGTAQTAYVSALTDLAAKLAEERANGDAIALEDIETASSQVSDLFGIPSSDLTAIPSVNIADPNADGTDSTAMKAALINAGIMGMLEEGSGTVGESLSEFVSDFVSQDGQLVANEGVNDVDTFSLEDILSSAAHAGQIATVSSDELDVLIGQLNDQVSTVNALPVGELTDSRPSPNAGKTDLDKAKSFIADIRLIQAAIESSESVASFDVFKEDIERAADLVSEDAESLFTDVNSVVGQMLEGYDAFVLDDTLTNYQSSLGFSVAISSGDDGVTLDVEEVELNGSTISLYGLINDDRVETSPELVDDQYFSSIQSSLINQTADVNFFGRAENEAVSIAIERGDVSIDGLSVSDTTQIFSELKYLEQRYLSTSFGELTVGFDVELETKTASPLEFSGYLSSSILDFNNEVSRSTIITGLGDFGAEQFYADVVNNEAGATALSLSGNLALGGRTIDLSLNLDALPSRLMSSQELETGTWASYSIEDNIIHLDFESGRSWEIEVRSAENFGQHVVASGLTFPRDEFQSNTLTVGGNTFPVFALVPDGEDNLLRVKYYNEDGVLTAVVFSQASTLLQFYGGHSTLSNNNESNTAEFWNRATGLQGDQIALCQDEQAIVTSPLAFYENDDPKIIDYVVVGEYCGSTQAPVTNLDDISGDVLVSASIRQNIAGIDLDDPEVELAFAAAGSTDENTADATATLELNFAGRRFITNRMSFDLNAVDGLDELVLSNQDGVVLTFSEDTSGTVSGSLVLGDEQIATITEEDGGALLVTYSDDSFESLL